MTNRTEVVQTESWGSQLSTPIFPVPKFLKPFAGKAPADLIKAFFQPEAMDAIGGAMAGLFDIGIPVPDWVRRASWQYWKYYIGNRPLDLDNSIEDFGLVVRLLEIGAQRDMHIIPPKNCKITKIDKWMAGITKKFLAFCMKRMMPSLTDQEISKFYAGRVRGQVLYERMSDPEFLKMARRAQVYLVVSFAWKEVEAMESHAERERWLRSRKVIGESFSSREVYAIFDLVGLPAAAPGRPKS